MATLTYSLIVKRAWPIILANAAVPLLALTDTAVIGHFGQTQDLAALAVASMLFNLIYWGFGFLRMTTSGFIAQFYGAGNIRAQAKIVAHSSALAVLIGTTLIAIQIPLLQLALQLIAPPVSLNDPIDSYFYLRIWAAPATLLTYVIGGVLIGRGHSRSLLMLQILLNVSNALLDVYFAGLQDMGTKGVALGTLIAEYLTLGFGLYLLLRQIPLTDIYPQWRWRVLISDSAPFFRQNRDIFIRTVFLLFNFGYFIHISGYFGEQQLAANHILLQLISFSAFFLDGFASVLEAQAGRAIGSGDSTQLKQALVKTSVLAAITGIILSTILLTAAYPIIHTLTDIAAVQLLAVQLMPYIAVYVALSVGAFQLDGLFIGATYGAAMRNSSVLSTVLFLACWFIFLNNLDNRGPWYAFIIYVGARFLCLGIYIPALFKRVH